MAKVSLKGSLRAKQLHTNLEKAVVGAWGEFAGKTDVVVQAPKIFHLRDCFKHAPSLIHFVTLVNNLTVATVRMGLWFSSQVRALSFLKNHKVQAFWTRNMFKYSAVYQTYV